MEETDRDPELNLLKQVIIDKNPKQILSSYKLFENELRVSMGIIFIDDKIVVPRSLREWVLQVDNGDHASLHKMVSITEQVYWPGKRQDLEKKAQDCIVCFQAGKNLITNIPKTEKNSLPPTKTVNEEIQFDFLGPINNEKGHKRFILVAIDNCSKWIWTKVSKACNTKTAIALLNRIIRNVFNNLLNLANPGRGILENVYDLDGNHLAQNSYEPDLISRMVFNRTHGRSASTEDLNKELLKCQVSNKFQYFVVKNHSRKGMESRFELTPHKVVSETMHTVSDGVKTYHKKDVANVTKVVINNPKFFQGKIKYDTKYKPQGRDGTGKFRTPDNSTRTDMVSEVQRSLRPRQQLPLTTPPT